MTSAQCKRAGVRMSGHRKKIPNVIRSKGTLSRRFYHIVSCNINISLIMAKQMPLLFSQLPDIITSSKWYSNARKGGWWQGGLNNAGPRESQRRGDVATSEQEVGRWLEAAERPCPLGSLGIWRGPRVTKSSRCRRRCLFFSARTSAPTHPPDAELMINIWTNALWTRNLRPG